MRLLRSIYGQVLLGIALGIAVGVVAPDFAVGCKILGDMFINLIKMIVAPVIFCTVVVGIAHVGDMKSVGRMGLKTILYFEVATTVALAAGLLFVNLLRPGDGVNATVDSLDAKRSWPASPARPTRSLRWRSSPTSSPTARSTPSPRAT
ncbi:cation:dicarboxylate symporter family transporter [Methylobacterium oryzae CBMB20]